MNPFDEVTMIAKQHQKKLMEEAKNYRYLKQAFPETPRPNRFTQYLTSIGKQLTSMVNGLGARNVGQAEPCRSLNPQTNPGGCV